MPDVDFQREREHALLREEALFVMPTSNMPEPVREREIDPVDGREWFKRCIASS
jgi:hypothetical protein